MVRAEVTVTNVNTGALVVLDAVTSWASSFGAPSGQQPDLSAWNLHEARFDWLAEGRWHECEVRGLLPKIGQELTHVDPRQEHYLR